MKRLSNGTLRMKPRSGQSADVDSTATKNTAYAGELHYCTDTGDLYYYNAATDTMVKLAVVS